MVPQLSAVNPADKQRVIRGLTKARKSAIRARRIRRQGSIAWRKQWRRQDNRGSRDTPRFSSFSYTPSRNESLGSGGENENGAATAYFTIIGLEKSRENNICVYIYFFFSNRPCIGSTCSYVDGCLWDMTYLDVLAGDNGNAYRLRCFRLYWTHVLKLL